MAKKKAAETEEPTRYTKYEKARILGSRALQISMGAPYLIKLTAKQLEELKYNPLEIAKLEFEAGLIPITVVRPLPRVEGAEQQEQKPN
ncbi:DNA-directed RNA polymerase subunit K [Candidatus Woesearchaeota archaeon]|nr:DNA-directed RNA polymerase subunit K [Candidatus Woesearchaeota archaeon]